MRIEITHLTHWFPGKPPRKALADVNISIPSGEFTAIVGPSGCGKSTLLRLAAGLLQPSEGTIFLGQMTPYQARTERRIAWMSQSPALLPWLSARQNVALAQRFSASGRESNLDPQSALQKVGLGHINGDYPFSLSGGMQQRLALARLLSFDATLWLMDEPFAALDEITRENLTQELADLWRPLQPTVLWVTHNIHEALRLADRVLVIGPSPGRVAADIPVTLSRPREESTPEFQKALAALRIALSQSQNEVSR